MSTPDRVPSAKPIACGPVMETGTFEATWSGVDELEIIVAPDTGESLIAVDLNRKAAPALPPGGATLPPAMPVLPPDAATRR